MDKTLQENLTQPVQASQFAQQVTAYTFEDVSAFTIERILYGLELLDYEGNPTDKALDNGLPYNTELVEAIGRAAAAREAMEVNHDLALVVATKQSQCLRYSKEWRQYHTALAWEKNNINEFGSEYEDYFTQAYNMINE